MTGEMEKFQTKKAVFTKENLHEVTNIASHYFEDRSDAEDLAQEVFLRLLGLIENDQFTWTGFGPFMSWCHKTVRNMALTALRSRQIHQRALLALSDDTDTALVQQVDLSPESAASLSASLPAGQRDCYTLYYIEGLSYEDTAKRLGLSESTVRSQCSRAKQTLFKTFSSGPCKKQPASAFDEWI